MEKLNEIKENSLPVTVSKIGEISSWLIMVFGAVYVVILLLGILNLDSPKAMIDPAYFFPLEILALIIAPLQICSIGMVYMASRKEDKAYGLIAFAFSLLVVAVTFPVHFISLTVANNIPGIDSKLAPILFSFQWPSIPFALEILAWHIFFGIMMIFASYVYHEGKKDKRINVLMKISGLLCLISLICIPLNNMQFRLIGIIGNVVMPPIIFALIANTFRRNRNFDGNSK